MEKKTKEQLTKKRGRKKLSDGAISKARKKKNIYFSDMEWSKIGELSRTLNFHSRSQYIREVATGYRPMVPDPEMKKELMKVRTDLNKFWSYFDSKNFSDDERLGRIRNMDFQREWAKGIKAELMFINKWIKRL